MVKGILIARHNKDNDSLATSKMDHADLIAEMNTIENLPTQERLHLARMRRAQQLKIARQKEKEWAKLQRNQKHSNQLHLKRNNRLHITFENSVVLLEAASRNDIQEVAHLLQRGITPDASNQDGLTALHQCCIDNNIEMLKLLLDYGANVDSQDSDKWTPLHAAATCGHLNLVRILINRGANLLAVNTDGNMPYDLCEDEETLDYIEAEMSKRGVTQELIDDTRALTEKQMLNDLIEFSRNGGDLDEPDHQGATPLHIASANGYTKVVEFLLEHHVNVDAIDKDMWSPVHAAACWGHLEVLEMLSQCGADLYAKNKDDETPSDICEDPEIRERIEMLKTEQESKRLAEQQRRRVRRSQSNNTRAQSVRRTSLRDKTLTTKKDAVEETRLRLQAQEVFIAPDSTTEPTSAESNELQTQSLHSYVPNNNSTKDSYQLSNKTIRKSSLNSAIEGANTEITSSTGVDSIDGKEIDQNNRTSRSQSIGSINNNGNFNLSSASTSTSKTTNNTFGILNNNNSNNNLNNNVMNGGNNGGPSSTYYSQNNSGYYLGEFSQQNQSTRQKHDISRRPPEGKDNEELPLRDNILGMNSGANLNSLSSLHKLSTITNSNSMDRSTAEIFQATKENGKINVQVTVLVDTHHNNLDNALSQNPSGGSNSNSITTLPLLNNNATTLANLKKQRSLSRTNAVLNDANGSSPNLSNRRNSITSLSGNPLTLTATNQSALLNGSAQYEYANNDGNIDLITSQTPIQSALLQSPTSSTSQQITKFSGITGDVVSDSTSSKKCCILM